MPVWLVTSLLLLVELIVEAGVLLPWLDRRFGPWSVAESAVVVVTLMLALRLCVALASYALSRWKGVALKASQRLGGFAWCRFFAIEYLHFCSQNLVLIPLRCLFRTQAERGVTAGDGPVVLLQHGYAHNGGVWFATARALEKQGYRVFTIDQPMFAPIDEMADNLATRIDDVLATTKTRQLILLAHSMGGLICRAYLRKYGAHQVSRLITLGSPHHGTHHARLASGANGAQMRPGNPWLDELASEAVDVPFTSIYSVHDTVIAPQDSSRMGGAANIELSGIGHVSMPGGRAMRVHILRALQTPTG